MDEAATVAGAPWRAFLALRPLGVLATAGPDGMPHAVPVEVVVDGNRVYVWCKAVSRKARNAQRDGRAALVAYKGNDGVLVRGAARLLDAGDPTYGRVTRMFLDKYEREETYGNDTLIEIAAERVTTFS